MAEKNLSNEVEKIISEGFMEEIQENTKVSIENILKGMGYNVVNINFK